MNSRLVLCCVIGVLLAIPSTSQAQGRAMDGPGLCKAPTARCTTRDHPSGGCPAVTSSSTGMVQAEVTAPGGLDRGWVAILDQ